MSKIWYIRNVDKETKKVIKDYAHENNLTIAKALEELVDLAMEHLKICEQRKTIVKE